MKRLSILAILVASLVLTIGCSPTPPPGQQPDDVVFTPGGPTYRANVHQQGVPDFWPPIGGNEVVLADNVTVSYRDNIQTAAGETRNNIVEVRKAGTHETLALKLSVSNMPADFKVTEGESGGEGPAGTSFQVLIIDISKDVKPREYTFNIDVNFDGIDYGQVPCTVKVQS